jgi:ribokinase
MSRVVCAGHVNWDVTLRVEALPEPDGEAAIVEQSGSTGGSAANVARVLAGLDVDPIIVGSVGADGHGTLVRRDLVSAGVDCSHLRWVEELETTVKYLIVEADGEVMTLGNDGANEAVEPADVDDDVVRSAEHLHLTSQRPETARHLAEVAAGAGVPVSFDPGPRLDERDYAHTVGLASLLFLNEREAAQARETGLVDGAGTVVETRGAGGATLIRDGERVSGPGFAVEPVDTTGAGDAFAAGFLAARLDGRDDADALAVGNACGALTARTTGSKLAIEWRDVKALLDIR